MEKEINLRDFISEGQAFVNQKQDVEVRAKKKMEKNIPHIELVLENDSDFILRRSTLRGSSLLVSILSQGIIYIKDEKTGEMKVPKSDDVIKFLSGTDYNYVNDGPKFSKLQYQIWEKGYSSPHLTNFYLYAIRKPEGMKILVNHKLFLGEDCFSGKTDFASSLVDIQDTSLIEELAKQLLFCKEVFLKNRKGLTKEVVSDAMNFFRYFKEQGINFDKIKYNRNVLERINNKDEYSNWWDVTSYGNTFSAGFIFSKYNLDFNTFINWLCYLTEAEAISIYFGSRYSREEFLLKEYEDYLRMQEEMYGKVREKYPENWLTEHHKMIATYNGWKKLHENDIILQHSKNLEPILYSNKKYTVIAPHSSSDVVDEGYQLGHCVGSYVKDIVEGNTNIVFMRYKETPTESLVTVEIKNGNICQYRGKGNRNVTPEEREFLEEWAKAKHLILS